MYLIYYYGGKAEFSASFRNHFNMLIWCLIILDCNNISQYCFTVFF